MLSPASINVCFDISTAVETSQLVTLQPSMLVCEKLPYLRIAKLTLGSTHSTYIVSNLEESYD